MRPGGTDPDRALRTPTEARRLTGVTGRARNLERRYAGNFISLRPYTPNLQAHAVLYKIRSDLDISSRRHLVLDLSNAGPMSWLAMRAHVITHLARTTISSTQPYQSDPFNSSGGPSAQVWSGAYTLMAVSDKPGDTITTTVPFSRVEDYAIESEYGHVGYFFQYFGTPTASLPWTFSSALGGTVTPIVTKLNDDGGGTPAWGTDLGSVEAANTNILDLGFSTTVTAGSAIAVFYARLHENKANDTDMTAYPRAITDGANLPPLNQSFGWVANGASLSVDAVKPQYFSAGQWRDFPV